MARQDINIGVEGNDGTGDSIRESFRKVNENFQEVYAVFGQGGTISFTKLGDTPNELTPNTVALVNDDGTQLQLVELASNSALDEDAVDTITFSYSAPGKLVISTAFTKLSDDLKPLLGGPLHVGNNAIAGVAISQTAVDQFNAAHSTDYTIDDLVITKGYADRRYISSGLPIRVAGEPLTTDDYVLSIARYLSGNIEVIDHGYDTGINGTAFTFNTVYQDPQNLTSEVTAGNFVVGNTYRIKTLGNTDWAAVGAVTGEVGEDFVATSGGAGDGVTTPVYFLRFVSADQLAVYEKYVDAIEDDDATAESTKLYIGLQTGQDHPTNSDDVHLMTDAGFDDSLDGNFLSDVAMPRESIVRRQGDTMEGVLTLSDHPGDIAGFGVVNGSDDLQAATKFYVDNSGYTSTVNLFVSMDGDDSMTGVPPGKEGSSLTYAFRTIAAAAKRAEEVIKTSPAEPGPYFQPLTRDNGDSVSEVVTAGVNDPASYNGSLLARTLITNNREFVQQEIEGFIAFEYPDFVYDVDLCIRDVGLILDAVAFDMHRGLTANYLSRIAGESYYRSTSSRYAIGSQQITESVDSVNAARDMVLAIVENKLYRQQDVLAVARSGDANERARVTVTGSSHGLRDGNQIIFKDMGGMTEINGQTAYVKTFDDQPNVVELYTDPALIDLWDISAYTNYTTGGKIGVVYQPRLDAFDGVKINQKYDPSSVTSPEKSAITNKFDIITNIMQNGIDAGGDIVYGSSYKLVMNNGSKAYVDQGKPTNIDTLPGKIIVGDVSGAQGRIINLTSNDGTEGNNDTFQLVQLNGIDFDPGESVKFGNFVKTKQVSLFVESGTYEEDLPIRLSNNVTLKGDEMRRVIIRPKDRMSQSKWADIYFYRDLEFDGIPVATAGSPFYNQTGELQGYFGRHYLTDPERPKNVGDLSFTNSGGYSVAPEILKINKDFIAQEVLWYIDNNYQNLLYNKVLCERDTGLIIDAAKFDMALGTNFNAVTAGLSYLRAQSAYNLNYEKTWTVQALNYAKSEVIALASVTGTLETDVIAAMDEVVDIIENGITSADAVTFPVPSSLPTPNADDAASRLQNNRDFMKAEILAWIEANYPLLDYNTDLCSRDVGYVVDALTYDILYGGNSATDVAARSYFSGTISQLGAGEAEATEAAYNRLGVIADEIVRGVAVTKSTGNLETQDTTGTNATSTEGNELISLVSNIEGVIAAGSVAGLPTVTYPNLVTLGVAAGNITAANEIDTENANIVAATTAWLDANITFTYDGAKCARDVGLIIDAINKDLAAGGWEHTLEAQGDYYSNYINKFDQANFGDERYITGKAIAHIATLAGQMLTNNPPTEGPGHTFTVLPDMSLGDIADVPSETDAVSTVGNLIDLVTFAFDAEYNPPKRNYEDGVDVFLMSDATRVQNCTVQGHGGFMVVLDPEGQVLTKSPYIQVGSSFSRSRNRKAFSGGMFVDAFVGNIPARITNAITPFELELESDPGQGLFIRPPELPCPFYLGGLRYQVNAIDAYDSANGTVKIILDSGSNDGIGYIGVSRQIDTISLTNPIRVETTVSHGFTNSDVVRLYGIPDTSTDELNLNNYYVDVISPTQFELYTDSGLTNGVDGTVGFSAYTGGGFAAGTGSTDVNIFLQTAGNRSMLGNDFTQINDLGYGLVTTNGALSEMVSMFTYYCQAAFYAKNGSEIRSTNGSNGYGNFGLVAEGADPNEIPDQVTLLDPMLQPAKSFYVVGDYENPFEATKIYVTDMAVPPTPNSEITINHPTAGRLDYIVSNVSTLSDTDNDGDIGGTAGDVTVGGITAVTVAGGASGHTAGTYIVPAAAGGGGLNASFTIVVDGSGNVTNVVPVGPGYGYYPADTVTTDTSGVAGWTGGDVTLTVSSVWNDGLVPDIAQSYAVYVLELKADDGIGSNYFGDLREGVANGDIIEYRHAYTHTFDDVVSPQRLVTRPSTAINFDESDDVTYRSLSFSGNNSFSQTLGPNAVLAGTEIGYDFIELEIDGDNLTGGYGSAQGDTKLAVIIDEDSNSTRLTRDIAGLQPGNAGYAGGMIFNWDGKVHQVTDYNDSGAFAFITFADVAGTNINPAYSAGGLSSAATDGYILRCGLTTGATAEITTNISLCRATSHDFTQIGTGGYNDTNYPNVILGDPENPLADAYTDAPTATSAQVWERRKGRVFWMSTDQYGFFRVGKFFTVDQGTGSIEFAGEIGLTNANSLGFKAGVTVNEFSADDGFADFSGSAVPTEKATGTYINRVLGYNIQSSTQIDPPGAGGNRIGSGFLPLNGDSPMEGDIDMGSNNITNLALPGTDGTAATNKNYVDGKVSAFDQLEDLRNIEFNNVTKDDLIVATGLKRLITTTVQNGSFAPGDTIGNSAVTKTGTIIDWQSDTDDILGTVNIVTYQPVTGTFLDGESIYKISGGSPTVVTATIEDGPIDEIANATEATGSVINWTVSRTASGTEVDFQFEDDTIVNADIKANAAIAQSKLAMTKANTFDEDSPTTGWSGSASKVQADLGLAKFSDENFETTEGYVRVKNNGLVFAELNDIDQYTLYGRQTSGTGDPEKVAYSDAAKYGSALEDRDFNNREWSNASVVRLVFPTRVNATQGDVLQQAGSSATGTVQGTVYLENTVYVVPTAGVFNGTGVVTNTTSVTTLGVPTPTADTKVGAALIKLDNGVYATTNVSTGTGGNTIARRTSNGTLDASKYKIGGYDAVTLASTTISLKTPGGATILSSAGTNTDSLITSIPGSIDVGATAITSQSAAQGGSSFNNEGFVAADWMYTNFIECEGEKSNPSTATTGIGLGAGNGYSGAAADTILLITNGSPRVTVKNTNVTYNGVDFAINNGAATPANKFTVAASTGNTSVSGTLTVTSTTSLNGNVNLGNETGDNISVNGYVNTNILPDGNTRNIGSSSQVWNTVYANIFNGVATQAKYADLAEKYVADAEYEPGTVLVFGGEEEVTTTDSKADHRVAGVVSTNPAHLMNAELEAVNTVDLALQGRVPCKVLGTVKKGDLLVTSAIPGYAIVWNNPGRVGAVIGKALENKETSDRGVIEIVVGRV